MFTIHAKAECTLARCNRRYGKRYDTRCNTNVTCTARKHKKCTEAAMQVHSNTTATSICVVSLEKTWSAVFYDQCCSTPGKRNRPGTQEDISSMISFIILVETNPCLWNFTLKSYSRADLTTLAWRKIAAEFKDTGKEVWSLYPDSAIVLKPLSPKTENCLGSSYKVHDISLRVETVLGRPLPNCV
jgi:hypothetical protein